MCQYFLHQLREIAHKQFPQSIIYHYMDILLDASDTDTLERRFTVVQEILAFWRLQISPKKKKTKRRWRFS